jgi:hypothetical protein
MHEYEKDGVDISNTIFLAFVHESIWRIFLFNMGYIICKNVCNECPFRKNALKGYFGQENNISYLDDILQMWIQEKPFPCHLKIKKYYIFDDIKLHKIPICRGYISMYKNSLKIPRDKNLRNLVDSITMEEAKQYLSIWEFKSHHNVTN